MRTLEPGLRELLAFGMDDEQALISGFCNNFDRAINLLCELHLRKNVEKKLQELQLPKTSQNEIVADIFGRKRGDIFESGLTDARSDEAFDAMLGNLEERWSSIHAKGKAFFTWFQTRKRKEFLNSVIRPVRQRAGLGSPPDRFTTNRSEQTNRSIQEFVKSESKGKKVDEFTFCVALVVSYRDTGTFFTRCPRAVHVGQRVYPTRGVFHARSTWVNACIPRVECRTKGFTT